MGMSRRDREWPRPRHTRFVWIKAESTLVPPVQGLVLAWNRHSYKWSALVAYVQEADDGAVFVQQWFPIERLIPVPSNPNHRSIGY